MSRALFAEGMRWRLGASGVIGGDVPRVPIDAQIGFDGVADVLDRLHGRRIRPASDDHVGVEVGIARLGGGERAAVGPHRDEVVIEGVAEPVAQAQPRGAGWVGDLI